MTEKNGSLSSSEVFRYGGYGTLLLIALMLFVGLYPLMMGGLIARILGMLIVFGILIFGTFVASESRLQWTICGALVVLSLISQAAWFVTQNSRIEAVMMSLFSIFCLYTAIVILRHVLAFGPLYADRVHAALSVYILLALAWAGAYAMLEIVQPGAFSIPAAFGHNPAEPKGMNLLMTMFHFSMTTLTSTGYGDITPLAPFARSLSTLEQLIGVFYVAVLISRLIGLYPSEEKD
jgi:hypothetical protein